MTITYFKKTLLITIILPTVLLGISIPNPQGYVLDTTNTLSPNTKQTMEAASQLLNSKTGIQAATLILDSLDGDTIEQVAVDVFEKWKIGQQGKDNGILFITAINDKKTRIEVGYGLEGDIPDAKAGAILNQYVLPEFKSGNIEKGIYVGHLVIIETLANINGFSISDQQSQTHSRSSSKPLESKLLQNPILLAVFFLLFLFSRTFRWLVIGMFLSGRGHRGGFGNFGGGGFGGFGGGSSGGGGASGGW